MWLEGVPAWKSASWVPPERRTADYDADAIDHDNRPIYKSFNKCVTGYSCRMAIHYYVYRIIKRVQLGPTINLTLRSLYCNAYLFFTSCMLILP
ncbi:CPS_collapsed_G0026500.mRNA.1.CDS.1 [Saccharomyces cerevisiae]|nr:CPS_collapsed_G0026500.mRNA.1.CDS.1 [Saccharomyces cerevisiae]